MYTKNQMTVGELLSMLNGLVKYGNLSLDTPIFMSDDNELNGVHACFGLSEVNKNEFYDEGLYDYKHEKGIILLWFIS